MPVRTLAAVVLVITLCGSAACRKPQEAAAPATEATPPAGAEPIIPPAEATPSPKVAP